MLSVSVIIPVLNANPDLQRCLQSVVASSRTVLECIVVDDGSSESITVPSTDIRLIRLEETQGPAHARNIGARVAQGDIVFFVDADVVLHPDALEIGARRLEESPDLAGVFGSYDHSPNQVTFVSQYRNLFHHWVHQNGNSEASSFWSGCGAIRRAVFMASDGFDTRYSNPSVEDIELGVRLIRAGHRIRLEKSMLCSHLKKWSLLQVIRTDLFHRGIPWVELLIRERQVPKNLNLDTRARLATFFSVLFCLVCLYFAGRGQVIALLPTAGLLAGSALTGFLWTLGMGRHAVSGSVLVLLTLALVFSLVCTSGPVGWVPMLPLMGLVVTHVPFYRALASLRGVAFTVASIPLQLLFFITCALSVPLGTIRYGFRVISGRVSR